MAGKYTPLETQNTVQRSSRFLLPASVSIVLLIGAAVGAYIWYYYLPRSCEVTAVQEASAILVIHTKRYDEVYQVATDASRTSLTPPVSVMKQILMDTQEVVVPACMQMAKKELINYMGTVIRAFLAYAAREADATVRDLIAQSQTHYDNFFTELKAVNKCAPLCIP
jgi:hypothetical protein